MIETKNLERHPASTSGLVNIRSLGPMQSPSALVVGHDTVALVLVTVLFFLWGFLACFNDVLVPHFKTIFNLNRTEDLLVQLALFVGYLLFSYPIGKVIPRIGYQKTMVSGLLATGMGAFLAVAATVWPSYMLFLISMIVLGGGMATLQVAANAYVLLAGDSGQGTSRLMLAQAFNSLGRVVAPALAGMLIISSIPVNALELRNLSPDALHYYRLSQAESVKLPYVLMGLVVITLASILASVHIPDIRFSKPSGTMDSVWKHSNLLLAAVAIFLYVGSEVSIGGLLARYLSLPDAGRLALKTAIALVPIFWIGALIGRVAGAVILRRLNTMVVLGVSAISAAAMVGISVATRGHASAWSILCVGLFNSVMFPCIFALGVSDLGQLTSEGSGLMISAVAGGAVIPALQALLEAKVGAHYSLAIPAICYLYILWFAIHLTKARRSPTWRTEQAVS